MEESFIFLKPHKRHLLTKYPLTDIKISLSGKGIHSHQRFPLVRGDHDLLIVRDRAEDWDSEYPSRPPLTSYPRAGPYPSGSGLR